jgi:dephospho-CoA kinase
VQRDRLVGRGSPEADAEQRIAAQEGFVERVGPAASRVIDTSGDMGATRTTVEAAMGAILGRH